MVEWEPIKKLLEHPISPTTSIDKKLQNMVTCVDYMVDDWADLDHFLESFATKLQTIPTLLDRSSDNPMKGAFWKRVTTPAPSSLIIQNTS